MVLRTVLRDVYMVREVWYVSTSKRNDDVDYDRESSFVGVTPEQLGIVSRQ
jgi:hypothetical protein